MTAAVIVCAAESCGKDISTLAVGAKFCSNACRQRMYRRRQDSLTGTATKRANQRLAGAQNVGRKAVIPGGPIEGVRDEAWGGRTYSGGTAMRCLECGATNCDHNAPKLLLPTWDGGMRAANVEPNDGTQPGDRPVDAGVDAPDPFWAHLRAHGPQVFVRSAPGGFISPTGEYTPDSTDAQSSSGRDELSPNDRLLIGLRLARSLARDDLERRIEIIENLALRDIYARRRQRAKTTIPDSIGDDMLEVHAAPAPPTALERIEAMQSQLAEILRLTADTAERIRERFPLDSEVTEAVDAFLERAQVPA